MNEDKLALVIEDESALRHLIGDVLRDAEFHVLTAPNGTIALDILRYYTPNVIVLDYMLPYMDGATFVRQARQRHLLKETPIMLFTASRPEQWARAVGAADCMQKPGDMPSFVQRVTRLAARTGASLRPQASRLCNEEAS